MLENLNHHKPVIPELIIFDLDGTLYDQTKLRRLLMLKLFFRFITFRFSLLDFRIITCFRNQRENKKAYVSTRLQEEQYEWCADILKLPADRIRKCIETYMYNFPLSFLNRMKYEGIHEFFTMINQKQSKIIVYSDYPVEEKLKVLGLSADAVFCSTQSSINQFKPSLKALRLICSEMKCDPKRALFIGDREDTDGEGARLAGIPFVLVDRKKARKGIFYSNLADQLNLNYD